MRKEKQTHWLVLYILLVAAFGVMLGFASRPAAKALGTVNAPVVVQEKHIAPKTVGTLAAVEIKECQQANAEETDPENAVEKDEIASEAPKGTYLGTFTVTHYCPYRCCNGKWAGMTASGATPTPWQTIAVDTRKIPMGSKVHIEGYGDFVAQDRGGAIKGNRIDVLVGSHAEALALGVKKMEVYLI